jgi:nucleotide-binding universal stress UspA family protein
VKILVPTDGSKAALQAFQRASEIATTYAGSTITLLAVTPVPLLEMLNQRPALLGGEVMTSPVRKQLEDQINHWLDAAIDSQPDLAVPVDTIKALGHPGGVISDTAADGHYDVVVVGDSEDGPLRRLLKGSTSDYVVHHSACDVLVVKA